MQRFLLVLILKMKKVRIVDICDDVVMDYPNPINVNGFYHIAVVKVIEEENINEDDSSKMKLKSKKT